VPQCPTFMQPSDLHMHDPTSPFETEVDCKPRKASCGATNRILWVVTVTGEGLERSSGTHGGTGTGLSAPTIRLLRRSTLSASENTVPVNATQSRSARLQDP